MTRSLFFHLSQAASVLIKVQTQSFNVDDVLEQLMHNRTDIGAAVTFTGYVRDLSSNNHLTSLFLEHYPGMTEQALHDIALQAQSRWPINDLAIIHRIGHLKTSEPIVLIVTLSAHRKAAFQANEFIMDYLKNDAPFWKKEVTQDGEKWLSSTQSDVDEKQRWNT